MTDTGRSDTTVPAKLDRTGPAPVPSRSAGPVRHTSSREAVLADHRGGVHRPPPACRGRDDGISSLRGPGCTGEPEPAPEAPALPPEAAGQRSASRRPGHCRCRRAVVAEVSDCVQGGNVVPRRSLGRAAAVKPGCRS